MAVVLAGCGGSDDAAPATTTRAVQCGGFRIGDEHTKPPECWPEMLRSAAVDNNIALADDAAAQAASLCRSIDISDVARGTLAALAGWETTTEPADDVPGFIAIAVAVYCPEHYQELRDSNG